MFFFLLLITQSFSLFIGNVQEVIIVGAGIAGLRASQLLTQNKIPHLVLESKPYIGGRVAQMMFSGLLVDKGASFVKNFENQNNSIGTFARNKGAGFTKATYNFDNLYYDKDENLSEKEQKIHEIQKEYNELKQRIKNSLINSKEKTSLKALAQKILTQVQENTKYPRQLLSLMLQGQVKLDGASPDDLSSRYAAQLNNSREDVFILGSFFKLFQQMFSIDYTQYRFNQTVLSIDYSHDLVIIKTKNSQFKARKVICTIPLGLLQNKAVAFNPSLPVPYSNSINSIGNALVEKLFVIFKKHFWQDQKGWLSLLSSSKNNRYSTAFILPHTTKHILIFYVTGPDSIALGKMNSLEINQDLQEYLLEFLDKEEFSIEDSEVTRWHLDPAALGSYSYYKPNTDSEDFDLISQPINGKLWLAGQHTTAQDHGSVQGAYRAGEKAGRNVLATYQSLVSLQFVKNGIPYHRQTFQKMMSLADVNKLIHKYVFRKVRQ